MSIDLVLINIYIFQLNLKNYEQSMMSMHLKEKNQTSLASKLQLRCK